jgi:putative tryptophan/tyrosine transport system substrate-binding protein
MRRRDFITLLGGAAAIWPLAARAQQPGMPVVGLLNAQSFEGSFEPYVGEIRLGLKQNGFVEGQNVAIEYRSANGRQERLRDLAAELVSRKVAVIVAIGGANSARAAKAITSTIPIVFAMGGDAVEAGLVNSLNRPEANVTGISFTTSQLAPKRLELLGELVPNAKLVGYLDNTVNPSSEIVRKDLLARAKSTGREVVVFYAGTEQEIDRAFEAMAQQQIDMLVVSPDAFLNTRRDQIAVLAQQHSLPAITTWRELVQQGGLISYAPVPEEIFRQAGVYAGRILKGAKPADLPVLLPARFELLINLKTAKTLGLTIPPGILAIADEVIE